MILFPVLVGLPLLRKSPLRPKKRNNEKNQNNERFPDLPSGLKCLMSGMGFRNSLIIYSEERRFTGAKGVAVFNEVV